MNFWYELALKDSVNAQDGKNIKEKYRHAETVCEWVETQ